MKTHGRVLVAITLAIGVTAFGQKPTPVHSETFEIDYRINPEAEPLHSVDLWFTRDGGVTWEHFGADDDLVPPMTFRASEEGLYGFIVIAINRAGRSSSSPAAGSRPQVEAFVDHTPPVVQLHPPRVSVSQGHRMVQIQWTAIDAHLGPRPVVLEYRSVADASWKTVSTEPVANVGRFDWQTPPGLTGSFAVRAVVTDRGGNRSTSDERVFEVPAASSRLGRDGQAKPVRFAQRGSLSERPFSQTESLADPSTRLFQQALSLRDRGEYREAIGRLREVVRQDPGRTDAFVEMADMLYYVSDLDGSLSAYKLALRQDPTLRRALRGAAVIYRRKNDHASAAKLLRRILNNNPKDAEVWINLGDVSVFRGDEVLARECYTRAAQVDPTATHIVSEAQKRLALMADVSPAFRMEEK